MPWVTSVSEGRNSSSPSTIILECRWNSPSYYVGWYKDGILLSAEDLTEPPSPLQALQDRFRVACNYSAQSSVITITNVTRADNGNYTCAVSCGARRVDFAEIPSMLTDSITVTVPLYSECLYCKAHF